MENTVYPIGYTLQILFGFIVDCVVTGQGIKHIKLPYLFVIPSPTSWFEQIKMI